MPSTCPSAPLRPVPPGRRARPEGTAGGHGRRARPDGTASAAADHPGVFSASCLLAPGPADPRNDPVTALDLLIENGQDRDVLRKAFRPMFHRPPGALLDAVVDAAALVDADVHRAQRRENATVAVEDRLAEVDVPTLLVLGRGDTVVSSERQHDMAGKLARTKEVIFSAEGHMVPYENPAATAREIVSFLENG